MIEELENVILTENLPEYGLKIGDVGTVVLVHQQGKAYEVEFMTLAGKTIAVITLEASQVRAVEKNEVSQARTLS